eukprot:65927-Prorocentrum_minimum.AAC.1
MRDKSPQRSGSLWRRNPSPHVWGGYFLSDPAHQPTIVRMFQSIPSAPEVWRDSGIIQWGAVRTQVALLRHCIAEHKLSLGVSSVSLTTHRFGPETDCDSRPSWGPLAAPPPRSS